MENKSEFLNEENYQKGKKKIIAVAVIVLVLGLLLGGSLIATGIIKSSKAETKKENPRTKEVVQAEIDEINNELATLKSKKHEEFVNNNFSEQYYKLENEISKKEDKISDLETEIWKYESGFNKTQNTIAKAKYIPFYVLGGFIIIGSCTWSLYIFFFAKRREILAFTTQQVMPVAQEGIEKMTPTASHAAGELAKGITSGIKEGLKEEKDK